MGVPLFREAQPWRAKPQNWVSHRVLVPEKAMSSGFVSALPPGLSPRTLPVHGLGSGAECSPGLKGQGLSTAQVGELYCICCNPFWNLTLPITTLKPPRKPCKIMTFRDISPKVGFQQHTAACQRINLQCLNGTLRDQHLDPLPKNDGTPI